MTKPLALLLHEKLMPGSQLASRFEEMDYRVRTLSDPADLGVTAQREMPMIVVADLSSRRGDALAAIAALHAEGATAHVPVIAYASHPDETLREAASQAGVRILATDSTILPHLAHFVEQALQLE